MTWWMVDGHYEDTLVCSLLFITGHCGSLLFVADKVSSQLQEICFGFKRGGVRTSWGTPPTKFLAPPSFGFASRFSSKTSRGQTQPYDGGSESRGVSLYSLPAGGKSPHSSGRRLGNPLFGVSPHYANVNACVALRQLRSYYVDYSEPLVGGELCSVARSYVQEIWG
jgi:hypothetical protein